MKRGREREVGTILSITDYLMLLSHTTELDMVRSDSPDRIFECKTCNRQFSSFQALGGHRASHKKQRLAETQCLPPKAKTHECAICGLEFAVGQALGGHMRRHRAVASGRHESIELTISPSQVLTKEEHDGELLCLDLNLTPRENGLDFHLNNVAPKTFCFL